MSNQLASLNLRRRPNADRAGDTRRRVMDSAIAILDKRGFSALTNALILADTGVSSGALMHHFPSRQALLVDLVDHAYERLSLVRERLLERTPSGLPRFRALIDLWWRMSRLPEGAAVNEVRIGVRSEKTLASALRPVFARVARDQEQFVAGLARAAGLRTTNELKGLAATTSMTMRALSVAQKTYADEETVQHALLVLRTMRETLIARQLGAARSQDARIAWRPA